MDGDLGISKLLFFKTRAYKKDAGSLVASGPRAHIHIWNVFQGGRLMAQFPGVCGFVVFISFIFFFFFFFFFFLHMPVTEQELDCWLGNWMVARFVLLLGSYNHLVRSHCCTHWHYGVVLSPLYCFIVGGKQATLLCCCWFCGGGGGEQWCQTVPVLKWAPSKKRHGPCWSEWNELQQQQKRLTVVHVWC